MKTGPNRFMADQNRVFACVMGGVLGAFACMFYFKSGEPPWWLIGFGLMFVLAGLFIPSWLEPPRKLWMKLATVLGFINTWILLTLVFAGLVTPVAILLRVLSKRPIQVATEDRRESYWHRRDPSDFRPERMERQF